MPAGRAGMLMRCGDECTRRVERRVARFDGEMKPRLRFVEVRPVETPGGLAFAVYDPCGRAAASLTVSEPVLFLLAQFDGGHTLSEVRAAFAERFGQPIKSETLAEIVAGLDEALLLAGENFDRHYAAQVEAYRAAPARTMRSAEELNLQSGPAEVVAELLATAPYPEAVNGRIVGLVAPHLDYPRGMPCYSAAYSLLVNRPAPRRVVILGTNHFGMSPTVVATGKDFATPLGLTRTDVAFIERLERSCGDLREHEFDHEREHSVELQLLICQHIWGPDDFELVPLLCPDPCAAADAGGDRNGAGLADFGAALRAALLEDAEDSLVIAGADLSHVGAHFGDDRQLDEAFAAEVRARDQAALADLADNAAERFVETVAAGGNPTRVCSAGCIYAAMRALPEARVRVLRYHQALNPDAQVGVTCAAAVFTE